jgi:hypothetical protein
VLGPDSFTVDLVCQLVEAHVFEAGLLYEEFQIVDRWEEYSHIFVELRNGVGQRPVEHVEEVGEVVAPVEDHPFDIVVEDQPSGSQYLCEFVRADALDLELLEVNSSPLKQSLGLRTDPVSSQIERKVELPAASLRGLALGIREGDTNLDDLRHPHVLADELVLILTLVRGPATEMGVD